MLKNLYIVSKKLNIVLFEKTWEGGAVKQIWSIVGTHHYKSESTVIGLPISYFESSSCSVTIVSDPKKKLICIIVHNTEDDSEDFGNLIGTEILKSFKETYNGHNFDTMDITPFQSFRAKIPEAILNAAKTIIKNLINPRIGIEGSHFIFEEIRSEHAGNYTDALSVTANFRAFFAEAQQTLTNLVHESPEFISLDLGNKIAFVFQIAADASLVTVCAKNIDSSEYMDEISSAARKLAKITSLYYMYKL